jgi:hypothetical protein
MEGYATSCFNLQMSDRLIRDFKYLEDMNIMLQDVINFETTNNPTGFINFFLETCRERLTSLLTAFQNIITMGSSGDGSMDDTFSYQQFNGTSNDEPRCTGCHSIMDEYKNMFEMHLALVGITSDLNCIKTQLNSN